MKKSNEERLYEYRIEYNATEDKIMNNSYHYFMATNAKQAFDAHVTMLKKKDLKLKTYP